MKKEHLFYDKIHGIIESVDKIIIQKKDWFYGKYGSQCTFSVLDVLSSDHGGEISKKLSMIQFQKEQGKYGKILPHGMELFWRNGIMILTMCM